MPNLDRFAKFADTLALVLSHPATSVRDVQFFQLHLLPIAAMLAGIPPETITAPRPDAVRLNPYAVFLDFALAVADVLDDDNLDSDIWNKIGDCTHDIEAMLRPENGCEAEAARMRGVVTAWARVQGLAVAA